VKIECHLLLLLLAVSTLAQQVEIPLHDGTFENAYTLAEPPEFVALAVLPDTGGSLEVLEVCFVSVFEHAPGQFQFEYILYSVGPGPFNLPGLWPGELLGFFPATNVVTIVPLSHTCLSIPITPFSVADILFFGARWVEPGMFISIDENGVSVGPGYARRIVKDDFWFPLGRASFFPDYSNLGLRLAWAPGRIFSDGFESGDATAWGNESCNVDRRK